MFGRIPLKIAPIDCGEAKINGAWEFKKSSSVAAEFTYTVVHDLKLLCEGCAFSFTFGALQGVVKTDEQTTSTGWSRTVEETETHGWSASISTCAGTTGCSGSVQEDMLQSRIVGSASATIGGSGDYSTTESSTNENTHEAARALEQSEEKSMTYSLPPGAMWQWYRLSESVKVEEWFD